MSSRGSPGSVADLQLRRADRRPGVADQALRALDRHAAGTPRLVNILAHKALLLAFGEGKTHAGYQHVRLAAWDTEDVQPKPKAWWWYGLASVSVLAAGYAMAAGSQWLAGWMAL